MRILLEVILFFASTMSMVMVTALPPEKTDEISSEIPTATTTEITKERGGKGAMEKCNEVMANNGLNFSSFWHGAAHGIHSIGLEEIQHFFEPEAPEQNRIPVVNANFSSEQTILFHAPLRGYDGDFKTMALKVMAYFMLNDKPYFFQQGVNTLEKLTHQYHMHEIYAAAAPIYKKMKKDPPKDQELCPCVNDVTGNGILSEMVNIAKQLKYFARQPRAKTEKYVLWGCFKYVTNSCGPKPRPRPRPIQINISRRKRNAENSSATITQLEQDYLADSSPENADKLLELNPWKPNTLVGPDQWISYEAMLTSSMLQEEELNDFAVFMYCKLNQPELDHAKDLFE